jgi:hypothetical protein
MRLRERQHELMGQLFRSSEEAEFLLERDLNLRVDASALDIYRQSIMTAMADSMAITFPVCLRLLGEDAFTELCWHYIQDEPSTSADLNDYGRSFADYISKQSRFSSVFYLEDMARLEWNYNAVLIAKNTIKADMSALMNLTEQQQLHLVFKAAPEMVVCTPRYPVIAIWEMHQHPDDEGIQALDLTPTDRWYVIWRQSMKVSMLEITQANARFIQLIKQHCTFEVICQDFIDHSIVADIPSLLSNALQYGWIYDYYLQEE